MVAKPTGDNQCKAARSRAIDATLARDDWMAKICLASDSARARTARRARVHVKAMSPAEYLDAFQGSPVSVRTREHLQPQACVGEGK